MFDSLFESVEESRKRFTVYSSEETTDLGAQLAAYNVDVTHRPLPSRGPDPFLVIEADGEFVGAISLSDLSTLFAPPVVRPDDVGDLSEGYRALFEALDNTLFTSMNRRELLAVSREIEDRAYRVGTGTLRASFQSLSAFEPQVEVYRRLGGETDLDVHVHGAADWDPPDLPAVTYHRDSAGSLDRYWALAFVEGPQDGQFSALVARQDGEQYDGFWTDDAEATREVLATLADA